MIFLLLSLPVSLSFRFSIDLALLHFLLLGLTPGPGWLEALVKDNVEFIPQTIERITPKGIVTADGKEREYDAIVCATGFDTVSVLFSFFICFSFQCGLRNVPSVPFRASDYPENRPISLDFLSLGATVSPLRSAGGIFLFHTCLSA